MGQEDIFMYAGTDTAALDESALAAQERAPLVIVADDDDDFRATIADALERIGMRAIAVCNGNALLALLGADNDQEQPDLIITDNHMPGCNGVTALEIMHASGLVMPAIVITGFRDEAIRANASRFGAVAVLQKPIDLDELREQIVSALKCG